MYFRKTTHDERTELARNLSNLILAKYTDSVLAVFIVGSTSKGLDRPYSDLEIVAIVRDGVTIPDKYYVHKGLIIEVAYPGESAFLKAATRVGRDWPIEADQYRNRVVLFERDEWLKRLEEAVEQSDKADASDAIRWAMVQLTEGTSALLNAELTGDQMGMRTGGLYVAVDATRVVFLLNRKYETTTSWVWKEALACPLQPRDFHNLIKTSAGFVQGSSEEIVAAAKQLHAGVLELVESREISIQSDELTV